MADAVKRKEPSSEMDSIKQDFQYSEQYLRQSIELNEKFENSLFDQNEFNRLFDRTTVLKATESEQETLFRTLEGRGADKSITNLAEFYLVTGDLKVSFSICC